MKPGELRTEHGHRWRWVAADVERGHWEATDDSGVSVFPASDGIDDLHVYVPTGGKGSREMVVHMGADQEEAAFLYGAKVRNARGGD